MNPRILPAIAALLLLSCTSDDPNAADTGSASPDAGSGDASTSGVVTWAQASIVFEENCVACHSGSGYAPFPLDTYESAKTFASASLAAMQSGEMPPFQADPTCGEFENPRVVSDADIEIVAAWIDAGTLPAEVDEPLAPPTDPLAFRADLTATLGPYTPKAESPDDWRCFLTDLEFEEETWVVSARVVPDQVQVVHHALIYAITPQELAAAVAADEADEGPGYTCFGGPIPGSRPQGGGGGGGGGFGGGGGGGQLGSGGAGFPNQLGAWVPGLENPALPEGMARVVAPGSRIVVQMHYNTLTAAPVEDASTLELMTTGQTPTLVARTVPLAQPRLDIPAGDDEVVVEAITTNHADEPVTFRALTAHAHMIATRFDVDVLTDDGEACLLRIPDWDFNWQQSYPRPVDAPIVVNPGQSVRLRCTYDNSAENQPVINGAQIEPRDVTWGEGTLDEMCLLYLDRIEPYRPPAATGTACASIEACVTACPDDDFGCVLGCEDINSGCLICAVQGSLECGGIACASGLQAAQTCIIKCAMSNLIFGGALSACFEATCNDDYQAMLECLDPVLAGEACQQPLGDCGL